MAYTGPTKLFINNEWVDSVSGKSFETINPANKQVIASVAEGDKADVDKAVKAARVAFQSWRQSNPTERARLLHKLADLIIEDADEFARVEALDNGKSIGIARAVDVNLVATTLRYYAGWADKNVGETIPVDGDFMSMTLHEPVGVCGQIIPWNFPLLMWAWKVGPALACGNCIVMKPAEQTPLTCLMATQKCLEAGFPPGVVNVVPGYGPTAGAAISSHPDIDKVAFTGSTEVGRLIMKAAADSNLKGVTLELGGKSPLVVFDDADVDLAVQVAHMGLFFNHGQCCCASSRLFVQEGIYEKFVEKAVAAAKATKVGDPMNPETFQGPQVDEEQYNKILQYIKAGVDQGAKLETGGKAFGKEGYFIEPTVFSCVTDNMKIAQEEIFGPVMSVIKFSTMEEAIKRSNDTSYGLAAGVVTNDLNRSLTFARNVRAGTVWVNCYNAFNMNVPFGGYKESGLGRELGSYGIRQYSEVKSVTIALKKHTANIQKEAD